MKILLSVGMVSMFFISSYLQCTGALSSSMDSCSEFFLEFNYIILHYHYYNYNYMHFTT